MSQEDYYTAMVMAASNYADPMQHHPKQRNNPYGPPSGMLFTGGASSSYCSSNNSSASSINQSSSNFIRKRSGAVGRGGYCTLLRKPTMENGPMHETSYNLPTSMMMSRGEVVGQPPQLQAPATYTHNPYATSSGCTSNDTSMNASVESYHSQYSASYAVPSLTQQPPRQGAEYGYGDASNLGEQFHMVVGNIAATACTTRGRHLLVSVLRLQHMDKIDVIFQELLPEIDTVALDGHGCHVVRTLVEFISTSQLVMMIEYLQPSTITHLATSTQHTRRVLQVMFERHRSELLTPLVEIIAADCRRLSMTQQGCITIMRLIENALPEQKQLIMNKLLPVFPALTVDPYGNYVVQTIVQNMDRYTTVDIITGVFTGHWLSLSCNKYASNVMERVVWQMSGVARSLLVQELVFESSSLRCLIQDSFGNFVLQAIIDSSKDLEEFQTIYDLVMPSLQSSPYRNKIEARLKGRLHALQQEAEGEAA